MAREANVVVSYAPRQHLVRTPTARDWARFDYYAPRVRRFGDRRYPSCREQGAVKRYGAVLELLSESRPHLLPNVRECVLDLTEHPASPPLYRLYLGPTLASIHIKANHDDPHLSPLHSELAALCPHIQHLTLASPNPTSPGALPPDLHASVLALLLALHSLRTISSTYTIPLPPRTIAHLAAQSSLTTLATIYVPASAVGAFAAARFSGLHTLHMRTDDWAAAARIVRSAASGALTSLAVECAEPAEPRRAVHSLLEALRRASSGTLAAVRLESRQPAADAPDNDDAAAGPEARDVVRPLLSCTQLRSVTLGLRFLEALDDAWLAEAAGAWPHLEHLDLLPAAAAPPCVPRSPGMTLRGVVSLVRDFPRVREIRLPLSLHDARVSVWDYVPTGHIRSLALAHPPLQKGALDGLNLWLVFPKLLYYRADHITQLG